MAAVSALREALEDEGELVREHAAWALERSSDDDDNSESYRAKGDPPRVLHDYS